MASSNLLNYKYICEKGLTEADNFFKTYLEEKKDEGLLRIKLAIQECHRRAEEENNYKYYENEIERLKKEQEFLENNGLLNQYELYTRDIIGKWETCKSDHRF